MNKKLQTKSGKQSNFLKNLGGGCGGGFWMCIFHWSWELINGVEGQLVVVCWGLFFFQKVVSLYHCVLGFTGKTI